MNKYTITVSGYGAEVYCHKLSDEKRTKLNKLSNNNIIENKEEARVVLDVDDLFMEDCADRVFEGADDDGFTISVFECDPIDFYTDSEIETLYESNDVEMIETEFAYEDDYMFAVNRVKGTFGIFRLNLASKFDFAKIAIERMDINMQISLVTNIYYDGKKLELFDMGDTSSKSITLILKELR